MAATLKDGSQTEDPRLDRLVHFDERSRAFPARALVDTDQPRSYTWRCPYWLDQGREGACVGFAFAHEVGAWPVSRPTTQEMARSFYHRAQQIDPWPGGSYEGAEPRYEGTSVLAGAKAAQEAGYLAEYRWAFSLNEALTVISRRGPAIIGVHWYEGMFQPDSRGFVRPTGQILGGHAILVRGVSVTARTVKLRNSWGRDWGLDGDCLLTWDDFGRLLSEDGECCVPVRRSWPGA